MDRIDFGIVGAGWRADFFLCVAQALPERFHVTGMVVRDAAKAPAVEERWGVKTWRTAEEMLNATSPAFVVASVPRQAAPDVMRALVTLKMPVLCETPPAEDVDAMLALEDVAATGVPVQIAEQYPFQPLHAARIAVAQSGRIGDVTQAQVSACHDYHGMVLIRRLLGVGFENATVTATAFKSPIIAGPGRDGPPTEHRIKDSNQHIAWLDFGGKLGVYDFTGDQYFSWVRSPRVLARGEKGEINNDALRYLVDFQTPIATRFDRANAGEEGNLEGYHLKGLLAGGEWVYRNPVAPARLSDDEVAVATCLIKMAEHVAGGPAFYGLGEACQDHYLGLVVKEAVESGKPVTMTTQPWAAW